MLSSKDKTQLTITGVLVIVLVGVIAMQVKGCQAKRAKYRPKTAKEMSQARAARKKAQTLPQVVPTAQDKQKEVTKEDYENWQGSPFSIRRRSSSGGGMGSLQLSGIVIDTSNPKESYAILNDYILKEGDKVEDTTVLKIEEDSVTVETKGKKYKLTMW